mmetsp:Transcript_23857/g.43025  ORF Transcript_23857/g.43025 Transcript_23857/m.43025 type:complete len:274 (-) Transcript_23857:143-964(-)
MGKALRCHKVPAQWIPEARIEPTGHKYQVRVELPCDRQKHTLKDVNVVCIGVLGTIPAHVDCETAALTCPHLLGCPRARVELALKVGVDGKEEDRRVLCKDALRPVAMVNVPVYDEHTACAVCLRSAGGHSDVVVETEPHRRCVTAVVPRGADQRKAVGDLPAEHSQTEVHEGPGCHSCGLGRGIAKVEVTGRLWVCSPSCCCKHLLTVEACVDGLELRKCGPAAVVLAAQSHQVLLLQLRPDAGDAVGTLRVVGPPNMQCHHWVIDHTSAAQ